MQDRQTDDKSYPKGHTPPEMITHDMMKAEQQASSDRGTKMLTGKLGKQKNTQASNALPRTGPVGKDHN